VNGGIEGVRIVPSAVAASGDWSDTELYFARRAGIWPLFPSRFLRFNVTAVNGDGYLEITDLRFMVGATAFPTVNMTSNILPSPLVASASSSLDSAYEAFYAFSTMIDGAGGANSRWHSSGPSSSHWIQIDLGAGNRIVPNGLTVTPQIANGRSPQTFQVLGSETGAFSGEQITYFSIASVTTGWSNGVQRSFNW
jgi:hypothetical protein